MRPLQMHRQQPRSRPCLSLAPEVEHLCHALVRCRGERWSQRRRAARKMVLRNCLKGFARAVEKIRPCAAVNMYVYKSGRQVEPFAIDHGRVCRRLASSEIENLTFIKLEPGVFENSVRQN